jgi:hypothetical protein
VCVESQVDITEIKGDHIYPEDKRNLSSKSRA